MNMLTIPDLARQLTTAFETKDLPSALALFAEDAVVIDPHYLKTEMKGKAAIKQGFEWAFSNMEKLGFTVRHIWAENDSGAIEVDTHHVLKGGMKLDFPQVFVVETRDGLITRLQAYPPYGPPGIGGMLMGLTRLTWRLQGKMK
jgi:ketosteroid isomerase-like protein